MVINENINEGFVEYKHVNPVDYQSIVKNVNDKTISENSQDTVWLITVNRLHVRVVTQWSCFVKTKKCPMSLCDEGRTLQRLLIGCYRTVERRLNGVNRF